MNLKIMAMLVVCSFAVSGAQAQTRTVIDKQVGTVFQVPDNFSYSDYGAVVGSAPAGSMDPAALSVLYGRFDKFEQSDDTMVRGFPYTALRNYEAQQVAAGEAPIFITATYAGKVRPVYFSWSLDLVNNVPTTPSQNWQYVVNVGDPRFVNFWINHYARPILGNADYSVQNVWVELDECAFNFGLFGVLDDNNNFVAGVQWDAPFPQSNDAYLSSVAAFFNQLKQIAPDIKTMPNLGSISDTSMFNTVFANVPGAISENIYSWHTNASAYTRNTWYQQNFTEFSWMGAQGKVAILRALLPTSDTNALLNSFVTYALIAGPNFFFAPGGEGTTNPNPAAWQAMQAALGNPTGTQQSQQLSSAGVGYRLYSRNFTFGTVYLNLSGSTQVIALGTASKHWDPNGNLITQISIPDNSATYVTNASGVLQAPEISPRYNGASTGPVTVTIASNTPGATIRYTLTGAAPTASSAIYTGPFELSGSATVQASAFLSGKSPSAPAVASYTVQSSMPTVGFASTTMTGPTGTGYPLLSLSAVPTETVTVNYSVRAPSGTTTTGSVSFLPDNTYRYFSIPVAGASGTQTTATITSVSGASIGSTHTLAYIVQ